MVALVLLGGAVTFWVHNQGLPEPPLTPPTMIEPQRLAQHASRAPAARRHDAGSSRERRIAPTAGVARADGRSAAQGKVASPRLAIVIDDLGESLTAAREVIALDPPVTLAVIPFTADASAVAAAAVRAGREVILHLPLEPERRRQMQGGSGFLETSMAARDLDRQLERNLRNVPYIVGVNAHMGSRFTSDPGAMETLLAALQSRGLFFLDSRTSSQSVAAPIAARLGVPFAERSVFLDHEATAEEADRQLTRAIAIAKREGSAIAIGHPYRTTIDVLERRLASIDADGVRMVPASVLVR